MRTLSEEPVAGRLIVSVTTRLPSRDGGIWAKFIMVSVAMIYFGRLSLTALSHKEELPVAFEAYRMPKWWRAYRHAGVDGRGRQRCFCSGSVYSIPSRWWAGGCNSTSAVRPTPALSCLLIRCIAQPRNEGVRTYLVLVYDTAQETNLGLPYSSLV